MGFDSELETATLVQGQRRRGAHGLSSSMPAKLMDGLGTGSLLFFFFEPSFSHAFSHSFLFLVAAMAGLVCAHLRAVASRNRARARFEGTAAEATSSHSIPSFPHGPFAFDPAQVDPHTLAMFQQFQGHVDGRFNAVNAQLDEIRTLVRQLAGT
ncbi:hypothetical protein M0R45_016128 [Rubus argutus]|uniref:Uncharacterized protein n=1 Tax=Rubus argutus TaxID=59490 RepID=A0AAW1XRK5_RUBAR